MGAVGKLVNADQDAHWEQRTFYRDPRSEAAAAFARPKLEWLAQALELDPAGATVLDVGAGNGMFTYWWSRLGATVTGLERSQNMIDRSACPELMQLGDAYDLPFPDDAFDVAFAGNLLHHLERPHDAVTEMARVARHVAIVECNRNHAPMALFGLVSSACRGLLAYSSSSLTGIVEGAGLDVVDARRHGYVYENRSPRASLPVARALERRSRGGAYLLVAARRSGETERSRDEALGTSA